MTGWEYHCNCLDVIFQWDSTTREHWTACHIHTPSYVWNIAKCNLTLALLNPDIPCLCKQCRSRSVGFFRSQLIWICTVCIKYVCIKYVNWSDQLASSEANWSGSALFALSMFALSMWIYNNNPDQVIWLVKNQKWAWLLNLFSRTRVNIFILSIWTDKPEQTVSTQNVASDQGLYWLHWGLKTHQPLWVILCCLPEKGRKDIEEEMKERDKEETKTGMKVKKQKK